LDGGKSRTAAAPLTGCLAFATLAWQFATMCGRYTYKLTWQQIVERYRLTLPEEPPAGGRAATDRKGR
jgi:hypothetical protein